MLEGLVGTYLILILLFIVLAICWIILPFAILGTKPLLSKLLVEARRTNELLERLASARDATPPRAPGPVGELGRR